MDADFEAFVLARTPALGRSAYLLTGDRHRAEELLQETLTRAAQRWERISGSGRDPEPYVRTVLYHLAVDGWRRRRVREQPYADPPEVPSDADLAAVTSQRLVLQRALMRLTPRQRAVLVLRFFEDLTEAQTAALMGCSVSTVKSQTRHALKRLRELAPDQLRSFEEQEAP